LKVHRLPENSRLGNFQLSQSQDNVPNLASKYHSALIHQRTAKAIQLAWDIGLIGYLLPGPKTIDEIASELSIPADLGMLLLQVLKYAGWIEQYVDDFAVSSMTRLFCQAENSETLPVTDYWSRFQRQTNSQLEIEATEALSEVYRFRESLRQWVWAATAKQASVVLYDVSYGLEESSLLELGGGASVFSAAFAYCSPDLRVTSIDTRQLLEIAQTTIQSIEVQERWSSLPDSYRHVDLPLNKYDDCLLVNSLKIEADPSAVILLGRCYDTLNPGGRLVIIEQFDEPEFDPLEIAIEGLTMRMEGCAGRVRSTLEVQQLLTGAGFGAAKWGPLDAGPTAIGLLVVAKP